MPRFPLDDNTADRLLSGELAPPDAPAGYARLAEMVRAAQGPATPAELAMQASVVAAVGEAVRAIPGIRTPTRRKSMLSKLASAKIAAVAAATVLGGTTAAAATGTLPGPAQHAASVAFSQVGINVPSGHGHGKGHTPGTAPGLVGNTHAFAGLCNAYEAHVSAGTLASGGWQNSTAFKTFFASAGNNQSDVTSFCSKLATPGAQNATPGASNDNQSNGSDHGKSKGHKPSNAGTNDGSSTTEATDTPDTETHSTSGASNDTAGQDTASTASSGHPGR